MAGRRFGSLSEALKWLGEYTDYERMRRFAYHERTFNVKRTEDLLSAMGNPERASKSVHVAGTKGKGSTSHMIAAGLEASGHRTGLFTSPHLVSVTERVLVGGRPLPEGDFVLALGEAVGAGESLPESDGKPTFFELMTAAAASAFASAGVEWAVYEVGLGGRLDSTNAMKHCACAITTISLDHVEVLGSTIPEIAAEKAGILKGGEPCAVGRQCDEASAVIEARAAERGCGLWRFGREIAFVGAPAVAWDDPPVTASVRTPLRTWNRASVRMPGLHQAENLCTALGVLDMLQSRRLAEVGTAEAMRGIRGLRVPGRVDLVSRDPAVIIDAAHNPASIAALVDALASWPGSGGVDVVLALSADKAAAEIARLLAGKADRLRCTTYMSARSLEPAKLAAHAEAAGCRGVEAFDDPFAAFRAAQAAQKPGGLLVVTGSFFLAGLAYRHFLGDAADRLF